MPRISALTALTAADSGDTLPILDVSATTTKKITKTNFLSDIIDGTLITSQKILSRHVDFSVADSTARLALASPFEGMECYQKDVDATYIYDGTAWRRQAQWEELGRTTLGSSGTSISVTGLAARKHLRVIVSALNTGGAFAPVMRFNNDSSAIYAYAYSFSRAATGSSTSNTAFSIQPFNSTEAYGFYAVLDISNRSDQFKVIHSDSIDAFGTDATTVVNYSEMWGKYCTNTQITRVDALIGSGAGSYNTNSVVIVLGRD